MCLSIHLEHSAVLHTGRLFVVHWPALLPEGYLRDTFIHHLSGYGSLYSALAC